MNYARSLIPKIPKYRKNHKVLEPVFIPSPESQTEDDGVVLTVIHDVKKNSFLVALDGKTFKEIARAKMPWHIPSSFHGQYFAESAFVEKNWLTYQLPKPSRMG